MPEGVTAVVPTAGVSGIAHGLERVFVLEAVRSIIETGGASLQAIVAVTDEMLPAQVRSQLLNEGVQVIDDDRPFNFSNRINLGVAMARTPLVLLLNDDTEARSPGWLDEMGDALTADTGAVGALLLYDNDRVQHLGQVFAAGLPGHLYAGRPVDDRDVVAFCEENRECSAITAACLLCRVETFDRVGGMSPEFPVNYNDTDFCLKVRRTGERCVVATRARLSHFESRSRPAFVRDWEVRQLWRRWWGSMHHEAFWRDEARALAGRLGVEFDEEWS